MPTLDDLPPEILHAIADACSPRARVQIGGVSRQLRAIADDSAGWERLYRRDAPAEAYALAQHDTARPWKARYSAIYDALREPFLTPPDLARPGDVVTVRQLPDSDARENVPCRVVEASQRGRLKVVPRDTPHAKPILVPVRLCCNGLPPKLAAAPLDCVENPEALRPGGTATIRGDLPFRTLMTTGLRPGTTARVHGAAL
ncbi:MAG TPA: F-box protein, partial [Myxococcota bacterium]|nr:F-box protein [Myxococcota bacterium]